MFSVKMKLVTDEWLREHTTTTSTNGWYDLIVGELTKKASTSAYYVRGVKSWSEEAVKAAFKKCR